MPTTNMSPTDLALYLLHDATDDECRSLGVEPPTLTPAVYVDKGVPMACGHCMLPPRRLVDDRTHDAWLRYRAEGWLWMDAA
jgi:hypothetical protein